MTKASVSEGLLSAGAAVVGGLLAVEDPLGPLALLMTPISHSRPRKPRQPRHPTAAGLVFLVGVDDGDGTTDTGAEAGAPLCGPGTRSLPQYLQTIASLWISSAQNGHFFKQPSSCGFDHRSRSDERTFGHVAAAEPNRGSRL
jgi:hypothetical protein